MIRVAWITALVLFTLTALVLLWQFSVAVVMFLLSLAVAAAIRPIVEMLSQYLPHKGLALAIAFGTVVLVIAGLIFIVTGPLISNVQQMLDDVFMTYDRLRNASQNAQFPMNFNLANQLPPTQVLYDTLIGANSSLAIQAVFGVAEGTFAFLGRMSIVIALSLYWSADHVHFERLWLSLLPVESRAQARKIWQAIETAIGVFLRREFTLGVISGVILWVGFVIMGIKYPVLLALVGAVARIIPVLGPILMVIIAILVGSGTGWGVGVAAAAYASLVLFLVETVLGKHIFFHQKYSSLLMVIVMIGLADSFGFLGVIFAPMLAVAIQILVNNLLPIQVAEPKMAEPKLADSAVAEPKLADSAVAELRMAEPRMAEPQVVETKMAEPNKMAVLKITELKITEPNMAEPNGIDDRAGLQNKLEAIKQMTTSLDGPRASEITSLTARLEQLLERSLPVEQVDENQEESSESTQLII